MKNYLLPFFFVIGAICQTSCTDSYSKNYNTSDTTICVSINCPPCDTSECVVNDTLYTDILFGHSVAVGYNTAPFSGIGIYLKDTIRNGFIYNPAHDSIEPLLAGVNNQAYSSLYCGVELGYMTSMTNGGNKRLLIKYAKSGSLIYQTGAYNDWNINSTHEYYDTLIIRINAAKAQAVSQGLKIKIKNAIFWMGANDANNLSYANAYKANVCALMNKLRTDISEPNLNIVLMRDANYTGYAYIGTIRTATSTIADSLANVEWLDTDYYQPGVIHKNALSYVYIGGDLITKIKK